MRGDDGPDHAGRATRSANPFQVERDEKCFRGITGNADVERVCESRGGGGVLLQVGRKLLQATPQFVPQFPLAFLFGLDILAGDLFTIGIAAGSCALWIVLEGDPAARKREAMALAAAFGLAALLAAPQIVSSALWAPLTHRAVVGLPLNVAVSFSLAPWRLLELLVPYPFGATWSLDPQEIWARSAFRNFFSTLFCGGLTLLAIPVLARAPRKGVRLALALGVSSAVVCILPWFLPVSWGEWRSPIPLRYPEKFAVGLVFALALAAGLAIEALRLGAAAPRGRIAVAVTLAAVAVAACFFPEPIGGLAAAAVRVPFSSSPGAGGQISAAFAEAGLLWAATLLALDLLPRPARWTLPAGLALLTAVPLLANRRIARSFPEELLFRPPAFARLVGREDPANSFRTLDSSRYRAPSPLDAAAQAQDPGGNAFYRRGWFLYTACLWGRATVLNADPDVGDFSRMESLRRLSAFFPSASNAAALFGSLSLRNAVRFRDQEALPGFRRIGGDALQSWDQNAEALPAIRVPVRWREVSGSVGALHALSTVSAGEVVLETGRAATGTSSGGSIDAIDDRPERLRFTVRSPAPSWVFVLRGFWPFRTVLVDNERVDPVPAQLAFSVIPVAAGRHQVDWREELPGGEVSRFGPILFLGCALFLRLRERPRRKRADPA